MIDELIIAGNKYISSKRAAGLTGYTTDYLGQLCRAGKIDGRLVGRNWYINEISITDNKKGSKEHQPIDNRGIEPILTPRLGNAKTPPRPAFASHSPYVANKQYEDNANDLIYYRHDESPLNPELDSANNEQDILENTIPLKINRHEKQQIKTYNNVSSANRHGIVKKPKYKTQQPIIRHHVSKVPIISVAGMITMVLLIVIGSTMLERVVQYVSKGDRVDVSTRIQLANVSNNFRDIEKLYQKFVDF